MSHAMVMGEATATMAIVRALQERGIRCVTATTERLVSENDEGERVGRFRFVRFREYLRLGPSPP